MQTNPYMPTTARMHSAHARARHQFALESVRAGFFPMLNGKRLTSQILLLRDSTATSLPVRHDEQANGNKNVPEMKSDMKREQNFERSGKKQRCTKLVEKQCSDSHDFSVSLQRWLWWWWWCWWRRSRGWWLFGSCRHSHAMWYLKKKIILHCFRYYCHEPLWLEIFFSYFFFPVSHRLYFIWLVCAMWMRQKRRHRHHRKQQQQR